LRRRARPQRQVKTSRNPHFDSKGYGEKCPTGWLEKEGENKTEKVISKKLPETIVVRELSNAHKNWRGRLKHIVLVTTLLDVARYPKRK
jgi:hypothetical protein